MTLRRPHPLLLLALVFAGGLALFAETNRPSVGIGTAHSEARGAGDYVLLADNYIQRMRETGDATYYVRAGRALRIAQRIDPRYPALYTSLGTLALARHDFRAGLAYGLRAHELAPDVVRPLGVIVDARIELGRYAAAGRTLQRMIDLKPNLASYARVSYFRELHGDLAGAASAMRLAVDAGGQAPENVAYVQTLLGQLELTRGHVLAASSAYRLALYRFPGYPAAMAGLARVDIARGRLVPAIHRLRSVVARLPLPEYVIALGDAELAAGWTRRAHSDLALVRAEQRLLAANGVNTDTEISLFEADHGSPTRAVRLARRSWGNAPSVRSADALGWALTAAGHPRAGLVWARRALRLGSRDPMFLYHAGMTARAAGDGNSARMWLRRALALNPHFSPLYAPRAERALR
jgi:tetratricopeptide (TPR) repeat protein